MVTNLAAAAGVIAAVGMMYFKTKRIDIGMAGNGAIAASRGHHRPVRLRRAVGRADHRRRRRRHRRRRRAGDRQEASTTRSARSRRTAWPASGARSRAACSRRRVWRRRTPSAKAASSTPARSRSCVDQALGVVAAFAFVFACPSSPSGSSSRRTVCGSPLKKRMRDWTFPSTACTAIRSSSSRLRSSSGTRRPATPARVPRGPRPQLARSPHEEDRSVHPARGFRADPYGAAGARASRPCRSRRSRAPGDRRASPSATAALS